MSRISDRYGPEVQKISAETPIEDIIYLLKRDGGVFVKGLVAVEDVDKSYEECRERLESDVEWNGSFFPSKPHRPINSRLSCYWEATRHQRSSC